jgi:hypothetical protein
VRVVKNAKYVTGATVVKDVKGVNQFACRESKSLQHRNFWAAIRF